MQVEFTRASISSEAAYAAVGAAVDHGRSLGKPMVAAIVDASGDTRRAAARRRRLQGVDHHLPGQGLYGRRLRALHRRVGRSLRGQPVLQQGLALRPNVVLFGGGFPIVSNGKVIGGVGVSGGSEEEDRTCAEIALAKLGLK